MKTSAHSHAIKIVLGICASLVGASRPAAAADPTTGDCLAASESSLALRNQHKLRDARTQLLVCASPSCPADIRSECVRRVGEVNASIPTVVFETKDQAGNDLSAVRVTMDGAPLVERLEGIALSIDPGRHTFTFSAAGQPDVQKEFVMREGDKDRRERIVLGPSPGQAAPGIFQPTAPGVADSQIKTAPPAPEPGRGSMSGRKLGALVAAGIGVAGLGVGTAYGLSAMAKHKTANRACSSQCDAYGAGLWDQAVKAGTVSTIAFAVGAAGLATGAVLWLLAPTESEKPRPVSVSLGLGGVGVSGVW